MESVLLSIRYEYWSVPLVVKSNTSETNVAAHDDVVYFTDGGLR